MRTRSTLVVVIAALVAVAVALPTAVGAVPSPLSLLTSSPAVTSDVVQGRTASASGANLTIDISPMTGSTVSGSVTIQAVPADAQAVSQIYWYLDSTFEGTDLSAPYCLGGTTGGVCTPLSTTGLSDGTHVVKAYMSYNQGSLEAQATFTVDNNGAPPATSTSPSSTTSTTSTTTTPPPTASTATTLAAPFVGLNVYELASAPGVNLGCGANFNGQWASFFSGLPSG